MSLATKLVTLRKEKGLTQMELAERLNVSRQAISRWEVGAALPSTDNLMVLAELYGVQIDYLLNDKISESPEISHAPEDNPIITESIPTRTKNKPLLAYIIAVLIVVIILILAFLPWHKNHDQMIPLEDMHTDYTESYSEGTFEFK